MAWQLIRDKRVLVEYASAEQCAAEALVRKFCVVDRYGLWFIKGVEILEKPAIATRDRSA